MAEKWWIVWLKNAMTFHHRLMASFLKKRGWVVFYLDERARKCGHGTCWMAIYQSEEKRRLEKG